MRLRMTEGRFLATLNENSVRYVVIGAWAFPAHDYARPTLHIDVLIEPTRANARRVIRALTQFGYDVVDITPEQVLARKTLFRGYALLANVHPSAKGVDFPGVWRRRQATTIDGVGTFVASLGDLIDMKRAAGRDKDKADLKTLTRLLKRTVLSNTDAGKTKD